MGRLSYFKIKFKLKDYNYLKIELKLGIKWRGCLFVYTKSEEEKEDWQRVRRGSV